MSVRRSSHARARPKSQEPTVNECQKPSQECERNTEGESDRELEGTPLGPLLDLPVPCLPDPKGPSRGPQGLARGPRVTKGVRSPWNDGVATEYCKIAFDLL